MIQVLFICSHFLFSLLKWPPNNNIYLQSIYSHSTWNLIEDAFFTSGVCVQHGIQACKRGSSTVEQNKTKQKEHND